MTTLRFRSGLVALSLALSPPLAEAQETASQTTFDGVVSAKEPSPEILALFDYDRDAELDVEVRSIEDHDGYSVHDITYRSPMGGRVPAFVFYPHGEGPFAGLVQMHGMPGDRKGSPRLSAAYARSGVVVIKISAPWARPDGPRDSILTFTPQDRREQIQLIQDLRRAVDFLEEDSTVDGERLGYFGGSYGAAMGGLLAGVEKRLKAYALVVGDGGLVAHGTDDEGNPIGRLSRLPKDRQQEWLKSMGEIEPIRFVGLASPSSLLFMNGRTDRMVSPTDAALFQEAGSDPKTCKWYETGHAMTRQMLGDQFGWMAKQLEISVPKVDS